MSAFAGIRVLDFSTHFAAAMAAMHLADFDAEVIKIDPSRKPRPEPGYLAWNRNKKRTVLDLSKPDELEKAKALIPGADVVIFDNNPGVLEGWGLDAATLTKAYPHLIHVWAPPYGTTGRWSALPPSHNLLTALTGSAFRQSSYADTPVHLTTPQAFYGQATSMAAAIGAALIERKRSGAGQSIVVGGLHGAAQVTAAAKIDNAPPVLLWGKPLGGTPSYRLYQCADGKWFFLGTLFQGFYIRALHATGIVEELMKTPEINGEFEAALRPPGSQVTMKHLEAVFRTKPREEWLEILKKADVPCGPVGKREDWFAGDTIVANGMRAELDHPDHGRVAMPGVSVKLSATPGKVRHLAKEVKPSKIALRDAPAAKPSKETRPPLEGVRVLDLGAVIAGAYAGAFLASFGADVTKIEPADGDSFRSSSAMFASYNRGKRGLVLDLKHPEGKAVFMDMVRKADVVLDNYRVGVRERLGIDYDALRKVNPRIISLSISGYGLEGPQASLPGFDPLMQAQSGMMQAQGGDGDEPVFYQIAVNDVGSAAMSAFGIIAALYAREKTGKGQEAITSLASQSVVLQMGELTHYEGRPPNAPGGRDCVGASALERYYECADGWIGIACATPERYTALVEALGIPKQRAKNALAEPRDGKVAKQIARKLAAMPRAEALDKLFAAGAPAVPVLRGAETHDDQFLNENRYWELYEHDALGTIKGVTGFATWGRSANKAWRSAPGLGQHTSEVLDSYGIDKDRIARLIEAKVVEQN